MVSTPVGESVVAKRVYINCPIMFPNKVIHVEFADINMVGLCYIGGGLVTYLFCFH